jgi:hypothetical protein
MLGAKRPSTEMAEAQGFSPGEKAKYASNIQEPLKTNQPKAPVAKSRTFIGAL